MAEELQALTGTLRLIDQYKAAYLTMRGFSYRFVTSKDGKLLFEFDASSELRGALLEFNENALVPVCGYVQYVKQVKTDLYNAKSAQGT